MGKMKEEEIGEESKASEVQERERRVIYCKNKRYINGRIKIKLKRKKNLFLNMLKKQKEKVD